MKIKVSYTPEEEQLLKDVIHFLNPILDRFKVKKSTGTPPFLHLYFTTRNQEKH